ncbi:MAG: DUF1214 domain-containing protein [Pseudomonadota bacterium]
MRLAINLAIIFALGLLIGGLSARFAILNSIGVGSINTGTWSASPLLGNEEVDPYTAARATMNGSIALGSAEGLAFETTKDDQGDSLSRSCHYLLSGSTPAARFWTLATYDLKGNVIKNSEGKASAAYSGGLVWEPDFSMKITVSDQPSSGNWLYVEGGGNFKLILRLYDTPIASSSGLTDPELPSVKRLRCG